MSNQEFPTRRQILKTGALAGAALACGLTSACQSSEVAAADEPPTSGGLDVAIAGYAVDRVAALASGRVEIDGCNSQFLPTGIHDLNATAMGGDQRFTIQEIGLHPYMLAFANSDLRDYTLIPVFPLRTFRHKSIFIGTDRGITAPEDLRGRKVAVAGYSQSSLVWIRGLLLHEYGIRPEDLNWVVATKASEGKISANEGRLPEGIPVTRGPVGKDESQLLVEGVVDAVFSAKEPQAFIDGDPKVVRLFPDTRATEQAYFRKTGMFPIMHAVAIRQDVVDANPWLPRATFEAYCRSKAMMYASMRDMGWVLTGLPWFAAELEDTRRLMGDNFWPYGIEENRKVLEAFFQYSYEQGLCRRRLTIDELFHPSTVNLSDPS